MFLRRILIYFFTLTLALPTYADSNKSVQAVEVQDSSEAVNPMAFLFQLQYDGNENDLLVKFAKSSITDLNSVSPEQIEQMWNAAKNASTQGKTLVRFPTETLMFYSAIAFNSLVKSNYLSLRYGYESDPAPLKSLENMFKDPVGLFSFLIFMSVNGGTNFYGADLVKWSMQTVARNNALRLGLINDKGDGLKPESATYIKKYGLDKSYFQTTKRIQMAIPAAGMAFGMLASRVMESAFHDENIQACSAGIVSLGNNKNWVENCRFAYQSWVINSKFSNFFMDFGSLLLASSSAHNISNLIIENAKRFLKKPNSKNAGKTVEAIFEGIEFGFANDIAVEKSFSAKLLTKLKYAANIAVKPIALRNFISTSLFLALDGLYSRSTTGVKAAGRARELVYQLNDVENKMAEFKKSLKESGPVNLALTCGHALGGEISWNCFFNRMFLEKRDLADELMKYSTHLDEFREFQLAESSAINTNWLNATNELVSMYQETHEFYKQLLEAKAITTLDINRQISPFEVRDFFTGVNIYYEGKPLAVNSLDDQIGFGINLDQFLEAQGLPPRLRARFILEGKLKTLTEAEKKLEAYVKGNNTAVPEILRNKIIEIANYLRAVNYDIDTENVLSDKELKALYKITDPKLTYISRFYNSDYRGIKELDLRLIRANYGLDLLDKTIAEFPKINFLKEVKTYIGEHNKPLLPGIKYLDKVAADSSLFSPTHTDFYPESFLHINALDRPIDYLVANIICGTTPEEQRNNKTPFIEKPFLYSYHFLPPALVTEWGNERKSFCENRNNYKHRFYNDTLYFRQKNYNGIMDLIADNLKPDVLGYVEGTDRLKFTDWWQSNIRPSMENFMEDRYEDYRNGMADTLFPTLISSGKLDLDDKLTTIKTFIYDPFLIVESSWKDVKNTLSERFVNYRRPISMGVLDSLEEESDMYLSLVQELMTNLKSKMQLTTKPFDFDSYHRNFNMVYKHVLKKIYGPDINDWNSEFLKISKQIDSEKPKWEEMWRKEYEASKKEAEEKFLIAQGDFTQALDEIEWAAKLYRETLHARHKTIIESMRLSRVFKDRNGATIKSLESVRADLDSQKKSLNEAIKVLSKYTFTQNMDFEKQTLANGSSSEVSRVLQTSMIRLNRINLKSMAYGEILFMWAKELY